MPVRQRTNFPPRVRKAAWTRADGTCEAALPNGGRCPCELRPGGYVFDHVLPDFHGGRATLDNCQVLCTACDRAKTAADQTAIADTRRAYDAHHRLRAPRKPMEGSSFRPLSRGFDGLARDRATGEVKSWPSSIDVRDR